MTMVPPSDDGAESADSPILLLEQSCNWNRSRSESVDSYSRGQSGFDVTTPVVEEKVVLTSTMRL